MARFEQGKKGEIKYLFGVQFDHLNAVFYKIIFGAHNGPSARLLQEYAL